MAAACRQRLVQRQPAGCGWQLGGEEHSAWRALGGSGELQQAWPEGPVLVVLACMCACSCMHACMHVCFEMRMLATHAASHYKQR